MTESSTGHQLGLALSGGGSRAAAFHRGTLRGMADVGLLERVDVVSTVSGGSVFAAGWMAAMADGIGFDEFSRDLAAVLAKGFVLPALLDWRALRLLLPGYSRTQRLAETLQKLLLRGKKLEDLPPRPLLVLNSCVLNHAEVARFSPGGLSCEAVGGHGRDGSLPQFPLAKSFDLGFPTAASAAFPFGLPPLTLRKADIVGASFLDPIDELDALCLTDGGVLENLGVQTLLRSKQFGTRHVVVSDAGLRDVTWRPGTRWERLKNAALFGVSADTLSRLLEVMNDKENRSMRQLVIQELSPDASQTGRVALMVLVSQSWSNFLVGIPRARLQALANDAGSSLPLPGKDAQAIQSFLADCGVDLLSASAIYNAMGGDKTCDEVNRVGTNFTGLSRAQLEALHEHARWQIHATNAVYGPIPMPAPQLQQLKTA